MFWDPRLCNETGSFFAGRGRWKLPLVIHSVRRIAEPLNLKAVTVIGRLSFQRV
jgi:hypothetical protein